MNQVEIIRRQAGAFSNILMLIIWYIIGNRVGENAVIYIAVSLEVCLFVSAFVSGGVTDTLGKMLRSKKNKAQFKNVKRIKIAILILQMLLGLVGTVMVFLLAGIVAQKILMVPYCMLLIRVLSPIVLLRAMSQLFMGYLVGEGLDIPAALVGVLRPVLILVFSNLFMKKLADYGTKVAMLLQQDNFAAMYTGLAVALAVCVAEILIILFLIILYKSGKLIAKTSKEDGLRTVDTYGDSVRYFCFGRGALLLAEGLCVLCGLVGVCLISRIGTEEISAYSIYFCKYMVICVAVAVFVYILSVPVLGKTFSYVRREDRRFARMSLQGGLHICMIHGIFFAVFVAAMGKQIAGIISPENEEIILKMLQSGSALIALGAGCGFLLRFLITSGRKLPLLGAVAVSAVADIVIMVILFFAGKLTVMGMIYCQLAALAVLWMLMRMFSLNLMRIRMDWMRVVVMPLGAGCVVGLFGMFLGKILTPHLGNAVTLFVSFVLSFLVYWVILLVLRNFKEQEFDVIPGGKLIYALGQILHVY